MLSLPESPLVSIVIPCRNASLYLNECLRSILQQSYEHWELVIVNDHSTDESISILQQWSKKHPNITVLENDGKGIIDALKLAYANTKGHLITRMDADDMMTPNKLLTMSKQLVKAGPGNIAVGNVKYFRDDLPLGDGYIRYAEWLNSLSTKGSNYQEIYKECVIPSPCWMMFRSDLDYISAFDSDVYPEDYDLVFRMYKHNLKVIPSTDEILHLWRDHGSRASRNDDNYKDNRFLELKVRYFLELDHRSELPLIIWGAGTKAKYIARQLESSNIGFQWVTNNQKKIGHDIYGTILSSPSTIENMNEVQIILAVAKPSEQQEIKSYIESLKMKGSYQSFWFC